MSRSVYRSLWGFLAFLPFCWLWGVKSFTWFSLIGTLYFIPVHWIFDKVMNKKEDEDLREKLNQYAYYNG